MSESTLTIRVRKQEKDLFVKLCKANDTDASKEIRKFMKACLKGRLPN